MLQSEVWQRYRGRRALLLWQSAGITAGILVLFHGTHGTWHDCQLIAAEDPKSDAANVYRVLLTEVVWYCWAHCKTTQAELTVAWSLPAHLLPSGLIPNNTIVLCLAYGVGTALFIPAGSSLCFSGSSTTEALDFWMTTANSRMFSAAAAPAAAPEGAPLTPTGSDMRRGIAAATEGSADGQSGVHLTVKGVSSGVDTGHVFTASEQVAAAVMAGAAGSSCPANVKDAAAASAADGAAKLSLQGSGAAPMETD